MSLASSFSQVQSFFAKRLLPFPSLSEPFFTSFFKHLCKPSFKPFFVFLFIALLGLLSIPSLADPTGATLIYNYTETIAPAPAGSSTTAGGSFTTLVLNATTQTPRWKAYVGNATGRFSLQNANNVTIYDWGSAYTGGEVYASRSSSWDWTSVACANATTILAEEGALNISASSVDSINRTFNLSVHRTFYVGTTRVANSTCRAIATYVNSSQQVVSENADFQEVLLQDGAGTLILAALIDPDTQGYDLALYDFQMIVPEDEYASVPHTYYFWLELS